ncbi:Uncharacterised protein [Mycobacterium tuberculosis]|nr:Uncharacterised protein [Mycobacterium tuberculosis]
MREDRVLVVDLQGRWRFLVVLLELQTAGVLDVFVFVFVFVFDRVGLRVGVARNSVSSFGIGLVGGLADRSASPHRKRLRVFFDHIDV